MTDAVTSVVRRIAELERARRADTLRAVAVDEWSDIASLNVAVTVGRDDAGGALAGTSPVTVGGVVSVGRRAS